ncbi:MAG: LysR family transcriptional regulator [Acidobacteria bacterium]|nr:MAG: LysR family transcriptional regulator [Acidobacteriota bacterium]
MELRHLRYLVAVADRGSFAAAARALHVAQSAISEQLANLEHEINVPLFSRSSKTTELTAAGEAFLQEARRTLANADRAIAVAQGVHRGETGTLRIGFFTVGMGIIFPQLIRAFRKDHPDVQLVLVELTPTQLWGALVEGKIDIGFTRRLEPEFSLDLRSVVMQRDPIMAVLPSNHEGVPGPVDLRDLARERFVVLSRATSPPLFDRVIEMCAEAGFSPQIVSTPSMWSSVLLFVRAGEGIALLPPNENQFGGSDIVYCPLKTKNAFLDFVMCWSPKHDNALTKSFRDMALMHWRRSLAHFSRGE